MEAFRILIVEDVLYDYQKVVSAFEGFNVDYYPKTREDFDQFSKWLVRYARFREPADFNRIRDKILEFGPDCIFLDVALIPKSDEDNTGKLLKEKIIDLFLKDAKVCYLTSYAENETERTQDEPYIWKEDPSSIPHKVEDFLRTEVKLVKKEKSEPVKAPADGPPNDSGKQIRLTGFNKISICFDEKIWPRVSFITNVTIVGIFYLSLFCLFLLGAGLLVRDVLEHLHAIQITEHVFIAFLPFLVVLGFFVFYQKSLKQFVVGARVVHVDYTSASKLMNLTKKLFVSSLISYLFIKVIEKLSEDKKPVPAAKSELARYFEEHPLVQIYFLGGCIALLILYYIYLNHHKEETEPTDSPAAHS